MTLAPVVATARPVSPEFLELEGISLKTESGIAVDATRVRLRGLDDIETQPH